MSRDTLSDLLRSVRLKGAAFFHVDCIEPRVAAAGSADASGSLRCGFRGCDRRPFDSLFATLPRIIHASSSSLAADSWISHFARLATAESSETGRRTGAPPPIPDFRT